jgi:hypothetical protein
MFTVSLRSSHDRQPLPVACESFRCLPLPLRILRTAEEKSSPYPDSHRMGLPSGARRAAPFPVEGRNGAVHDGVLNFAFANTVDLHVVAQHLRFAET